jgi:pyruvate-ferredoxin/flavodoxin oxidoreductase
VGPKSSSIVVDGNEAAARVAYQLSEVMAIYPITPSSPMAEHAEAWAASSVPNIWGTVPIAQQMQSEAGAAGALHGALQAGTLATSFTASQGLLLMIPNMYKIAGELTPCVIHVAARTVATSALSIFGDHGDVMGARATGWAMLFASSVQEAQDFALVSHAATLDSRVPFLHVFDGFRTSHEVAKITPLGTDEIRAVVDEDSVRAFRQRALTPEAPVVRGTAQNPDVHFQAREAANPFYDAVPQAVEAVFRKLGDLTGREYGLFDYVGHPEADRVIVLMGSGAETASQTVEDLISRGERVGVVKVRLYRPFSAFHFVMALPPTTRAIAVLDRCKEPGAPGEPLYQDVVSALAELVANNQAPFPHMPRVVGGRYGLSSKEFDPPMVHAIFRELERSRPKNHFTVGIQDDVSYSSLEVDPDYRLRNDDVFQAVFYGLGSDGTVSANKNTIKIVGEATDLYGQGYFEYDSKKSGSTTVSHLRFSPRPIQSAYLVEDADFIGVHWFPLLTRQPILDRARVGAKVLLNTRYPAEAVWDELPRPIQDTVLDKRLELYCLDARSLAEECGLSGRINTIMQAAFFSLSGLLPLEEALAKMKRAIHKSYGKAGEAVLRANERAVDLAVSRLRRVEIREDRSGRDFRSVIPDDAPEFVRDVTQTLLRGEGNALPVSAIPADGTFPSGTAAFEKRGIAAEVPIWDHDLCIQCGKCVLVCPHAAIRAKLAAPDQALDLESVPAKWRGAEELRYVLRVSYEDCTGCTLCREVCPAVSKTQPDHRALNMVPAAEVGAEARRGWETFLSIPDKPEIATPLKYNNVKNIQLLRPLFEFSGACSGCGETPYLKLLSQLFGERALVANATGCSSIFGGNLPTTPWTKNAQGRGPAWSNSLFEDNAEFGLGMRIACDTQKRRAQQLVQKLAMALENDLVEAFVGDNPASEPEVQRRMVDLLKASLRKIDSPDARALLEVADSLVDRSIWLVGGDGWAYDIGFGGLDHVLHSGMNVNVLVMDTEVYSNTGGQASKSTSRGAIAGFATGGKSRPKKELGRIAIGYGNVYVAQVALGASDAQLVKAFLEAESFPGPSLILAYSHCIAHGIEMGHGLDQQARAVETGYWPLYRFDPRRALDGENPMQIDSKPPSRPLEDYLFQEDRYARLQRQNPAAAQEMLRLMREDVEARWKALRSMG